MFDQAIPLVLVLSIRYNRISLSMVFSLLEIQTYPCFRDDIDYDSEISNENSNVRD